MFTYSNIGLGYDPKGVSTDLTDYIGFKPRTLSNSYPTTLTRIDPNTGYIFQVGNGYNATTQTYLPGNGNAVLLSNAQGLYTTGTPSNREKVLAHWYNNIFVPNTPNQPYIRPNTFSQKYTTDSNNLFLTNIYSYPYTQYITRPNPYNTLSNLMVAGQTIQTTVPLVVPPGYDQPNNYVYDLSGFQFRDGKLALGNGIMGISLIPDDGVWDVSRIMLRSAFTTTDSNIDTNRQIRYLGIYFASYLNELTGEQVKLSNAKMVFELNKVVTYNSNTPLNFGFDEVGGTYYEWTKMSTISADPSYLYGYAQDPQELIPDSNSYYSIVPFDANSTITTYSLLSGSVTPYPFYTDASACSLYLDGAQSPTGQYVVIPKINTLTGDPARGPPAGFDITQSQYEQSIPLVNSMLQYLQPPQLISDPSGCQPFATAAPEIFRDISGAPPYMTPNFRVPNYALFPIGGALSLYSYKNNTTERIFTYVNTITLDIFFKNLVNANFVGMSGNTTLYAFLGLSKQGSDLSGNLNFTFQIETYNIKTELVVITDKLTLGNPIILPTGYDIIGVDSFNYNDAGGFTFTYTIGLWDPMTESYTNSSQIGITKGSPTTDSSQPFYVMSNSLMPSPTQPLIQYEILQANRELFGRFYVSVKTDFYAGSTLFPAPTANNYPNRFFLGNSNFVLDPAYSANGLFFADTVLTITSEQATMDASNAATLGITLPTITYLGSNLSPRITKLNLLPDNHGVSPAAFADFTIVQNPFESRLFLSYEMYDMSNNGGLPSAPYYEITRIEYDSPLVSNAYYAPAVQSITDYNHSTIQADKITGGGGGSFWLTFNEALNTGYAGHRYDSIWGNRGDSVDFPVNISNAYQIFLPTQRIVMKKVGVAYNPMTDISGLTLAEYPHTNMFAYSNYNTFASDCLSGSWGQESPYNFIVSDTKFSGYTFNAAALDIPHTSTTEFSYLAVRGYSPTEKSQVMLRFSLPNRYDFGYVSIRDLSNEIVLSMSTPRVFDLNYANVIQAFNSNFIFDSNGKVFGSNVVQGYPGSNLSNVAGFGDFMKRFIDLYNSYNTNVLILNDINTSVASNIKNFVTTDLGNIIPASAATRQRYTDPLIYSILWKSALTGTYVTAEDEWGLGWNLGYAKKDSSYDTTHVAESFFKILDDFINLRLNPEFDMNRMDTGAKENRSQTQEPTGSVKAYYAKLLLASFGSYAQTLISNPINFQIAIPKIDKLSFTWVDTLGQTIDNGDCEWNMVIQMVENLDIVRPAPPAKE
jgi:hypothetical protein